MFKPLARSNTFHALIQTKSNMTTKPDKHIRNLNDKTTKRHRQVRFDTHESAGYVNNTSNIQENFNSRGRAVLFQPNPQELNQLQNKHQKVGRSLSVTTPSASAALIKLTPTGRKSINATKSARNSIQNKRDSKRGNSVLHGWSEQNDRASERLSQVLATIEKRGSTPAKNYLAPERFSTNSHQENRPKVKTPANLNNSFSHFTNLSYEPEDDFNNFPAFARTRRHPLNRTQSAQVDDEASSVNSLASSYRSMKNTGTQPINFSDEILDVQMLDVTFKKIESFGQSFRAKNLRNYKTSDFSYSHSDTELNGPRLSNTQTRKITKLENITEQENENKSRRGSVLSKHSHKNSPKNYKSKSRRNSARRSKTFSVSDFKAVNNSYRYTPSPKNRSPKLSRKPSNSDDSDEANEQKSPKPSVRTSQNSKASIIKEFPKLPVIAQPKHLNYLAQTSSDDNTGSDEKKNQDTIEPIKRKESNVSLKSNFSRILGRRGTNFAK